MQRSKESELPGCHTLESHKWYHAISILISRGEGKAGIKRIEKVEKNGFVALVRCKIKSVPRKLKERVLLVSGRFRVISSMYV